MKNFIWSEFGVLDHWSLMDDGTLFIYNDQNQFRKMSPKYGLTIKKIIEKSDALKGYNVQIRTSQNTGQFSILEWFSDLSLSNTKVRIQEGSVTNVEPYSELNKKIEAMKKEINEQKRLVEHEQEEKEKLSQRLIKASDKAEDYQAKNTELMEKYIQLQNYYDELTRTEQDEVDNVAHELLGMELVGTKNEGVFHPHTNNGLFNAIKDKGVRIMSVGHDHNNDFCGVHEGVNLCYAGGIGYTAYGRDEWPRRARVFDAYPNGTVVTVKYVDNSLF